MDTPQHQKLISGFEFVGYDPATTKDRESLVFARATSESGEDVKIDLERMRSALNACHGIPTKALADGLVLELVRVLRNVEREKDLRASMDDCARRRVQKGLGGTFGLHGLLVHDDEDAREAQGYYWELEALRDKREAVLEALEGV